LNTTDEAYNEVKGNVTSLIHEHTYRAIGNMVFCSLGKFI